MQNFRSSSEPLFELCCDIATSMFTGTSRWRELLSSTEVLKLSDAELATCMEAGSRPNLRVRMLVFQVLRAAVLRRHLERHGGDNFNLLLERWLALEGGIAIAHLNTPGKKQRQETLHS